MRISKRAAQKRNDNRIVRVRSDKIHKCLRDVSSSLNCPYQTCFEVLCEMFEDGYVFGKNSRDVLTQRILEKFTGDCN